MASMTGRQALEGMRGRNGSHRWRAVSSGGLVLGLVIAASTSGCGGSENADRQDGSARKDGADGMRQPDVLPSDPRLGSDLPSDQSVADGGRDLVPAGGEAGRAGLDGEGADRPALDGVSPGVDGSDDAADVAVDVPADVPQSDLPKGEGPPVRLDVGPVCTEGATQTCASPDNPLLGACHGGTRACKGGAWGPCSEVLPAASEDCNGIDDNCNGMIDEGCVLGCTVVCGKCSGSDAAVADGSVAHPFPTIEAALAAAAPMDGGAARKRICLVGGATCKESTLYPTTAPLRMTDGLIIQGSYAITETGLQYCGVLAVRPKTIITLAASEGVVFDETVVAGAELSSLVVEVNPPSGTDAAATASAIAVKGAKNVILSRVFVSEGFAATNTRGVSVSAGGQATVTESSITTGQGRTSAVAAYVNGGTVSLRNNCDRLVGGKCASYCDDGGSMLGFHGDTTAGAADAPLESSAVFVVGGASALVGNMICGGNTRLADGQAAVTIAALRCESGGCATVSGNVMAGGDDREAITVAVTGADPLLDGNLIEAGCGARTATTTAVRLETSSARLQNNLILGAQCAGAGTPAFHGLHLLSRGTSDHPEVSSNTIEPLGLVAECESVGVLVELVAGAESATSGVLRNNIISTGVCNRRFAIREVTGASLQSLQNNDLYAPAVEAAATPAVLYHHGDKDETTAAAVNAIALASGNLSGDPQYASYPRDLHLTGQSPCVDQGTSNGAPASDLDGNARPAGAGYDIGAYELAP